MSYEALLARYGVAAVSRALGACGYSALPAEGTAWYAPCLEALAAYLGSH